MKKIKLSIAILLIAATLMNVDMSSYVYAADTENYVSDKRPEQQIAEWAQKARYDVIPKNIDEGYTYRNEEQLSNWAKLATKNGEPIRAAEPEIQEKGIELDEIAAEAFASTTVDLGEEVLERAVENASDMAKSSARAGLAKVLIKLAGIIGIIKDIQNMGNLTGEHVMTKTIQVLALLADIAVLAMGVLGLGGIFGLGFPWTILLGFFVSFLAEFFMNEGVAARLDDFFNLCFLWTHSKLPSTVNALKPNIYIYSDVPQQVEVRFKRPDLLTVSIPEYNLGWSVETGVDGILTNETGDSYGFLFYESKSRKELFQTTEGYRIGADTRTEQFEEILTNMNFNEQEIKDFIEFWTVKLDKGVDYIMYPQDTPTIDIAMPIEITPYPHSIERIWFCFEADKAQDITEPETIILERDEQYSVVEWGGIIFE